MSVVVITGSSSGIGMATAQVLARRGHRVFATMRRPEKSALAQALAAETLPIRLLAMDVDRDASVRAAFREVARESGHIDVLVNNAGVEVPGSVEETSLNAFRGTMETNFFGAIRCIQAVLPGMRERRSGCIMNVSSVAGRMAVGGEASYCASKWALEAASEALAQEVKPFGIRVAVIEPGVIRTPIFDKGPQLRQDTPYPQERRMSALFQASLRNPVPPEVVAETILGIVDNGTWQLRHPVGPDAAPFLAWRAGMTDEQWIDYWAQSDAGWVAAIQRDFGLAIDLNDTLRRAAPKPAKAAEKRTTGAAGS